MSHIPSPSHQNNTDSFRQLNKRIVFYLLISTTDSVEEILPVFRLDLSRVSFHGYMWQGSSYDEFLDHLQDTIKHHLSILQHYKE